MADFEFAIEWYFVHNTLHERGFTSTVFTHECHLLTTLNGESAIVKHIVVAIRFRQIIGNNRIVARTRRRWKF